MKNEDNGYNMKAVTKLLGIQPTTLRAWERRYKIIAPKRNDAGHRLYTETHIQILKWLIQKTKEGFTIGQAVSLLENGGYDEIGAIRIRKDPQLSPFREVQTQLLEALLNFDDIKAQQLLNRAFSIYSLEYVLVHIIFHVIESCWRMYEAKQITSINVQYIATYFRSKIGAIHIANIGQQRVKNMEMVIVGGPGENDENGSLIFSLFLEQKGYSATYLGAGVHYKDVQEFMVQTKPSFIILTCLKESNLEATIQWSHQLYESSDNPNLIITIISLNANESMRNSAVRTIGFSLLDWDNWLESVSF